MIRLAIVGMGTIFHTQIQALKTFHTSYEITAVCDLLYNNFHSYFSNKSNTIPQYYESIEELLQHANCDAVLISTPPTTHFHLASLCLSHRKNVLLEKPAVTKLDDLFKLYEIANSNKVILQIAYHAAFGSDLIWYLNHQHLYHEYFNCNSISNIECSFFDPYASIINNEVIIQASKKNMGGSYLDSAVNQLSVCDKLIDLSGFKLSDKVINNDTSISPFTYASSTIFQNATCAIHLETSWIKNLNQKRTLISYHNSKRKILLDHSNQCVLLVDGFETSILFQEKKIDRLLGQYIGVFKDFEMALLNNSENKSSTQIIHSLLYS